MLQIIIVPRRERTCLELEWAIFRCVIRRAVVFISEPVSFQLSERREGHSGFSCGQAALREGLTEK